MPRNTGEKEKIEKRMRIERTVIPFISVTAIAVFIIIGATVGRKHDSKDVDLDLLNTPAPTEDPCFPLIRNMSLKLDGTYTEADGFSTLCLKSRADNADTIITSYTKSGIVCMQIIRSMGAGTAAFDEPSPTPTEALFYVDRIAAPTPTQYDPVSDILSNIGSIATELQEYLSFLYEPAESSETIKMLRRSLNTLVSGEAKKTSFVYGIYLVELSYSKNDYMLKIVCEPA